MGFDAYLALWEFRGTITDLPSDHCPTTLGGIAAITILVDPLLIILLASSSLDILSGGRYSGKKYGLALFTFLPTTIVGNSVVPSSSSSCDISMYCRVFVAGTGLSRFSSSVSVSISLDFAARFDVAGGTFLDLVSRFVRVEIFDLGDTLNFRLFGVVRSYDLLLELPEKVRLREGPA